MTRRTSMLTAVAAGAVIAASVALGQQAARDTAGDSTDVLDPMAAARSPHHLLRNGLDYLTYQEYERALTFFREAEARQGELSSSELRSLRGGIEKAQKGLREAANKPRKSYAKSQVGGRPGAIATVQPEGDSFQLASVNVAQPGNVAPAVKESSPPPLPTALPEQVTDPQTIAPFEPVQTSTENKVPIVSRERPEPTPRALVALPSAPATVETVQPTVDQEKPSVGLSDLPPLPAEGPEAEPLLPQTTAVRAVNDHTDGQQDGTSFPRPFAPPQPVGQEGTGQKQLGEEVTGQMAAAPSQAGRPVGSEGTTEPGIASLPTPTREAAKGIDLSDLPPLPEETKQIAPTPVATTAVLDPLPEQSVPNNPPVTTSDASAPVQALKVEAASELQTPSPVTVPRIEGPVSLANSAERPLPGIDPAPAAENLSEDAPVRQLKDSANSGGSEAPSIKPRLEDIDAGPIAPTSVAATGDPAAAVPVPESFGGVTAPRVEGSHRSSLSPELQDEVARIAQMQEEAARRARSSLGVTRDLSSEPEQPTARLELPRAPSPTEARPLRAISVPEEFVPLAPRDWSPNRKYWAAAATCHSPLYFQDAVLERYGYSVEQRFGRAGRFLTFPLDDPTQSKQRNQILQPLFSYGLFAFQIAALPYNLIVDPPWEAEYDLGYYRPGDRVPTDVYYLPWHGIGPPLHGMNY